MHHLPSLVQGIQGHHEGLNDSSFLKLKEKLDLAEVLSNLGIFFITVLLTKNFFFLFVV